MDSSWQSIVKQIVLTILFASSSCSTSERREKRAVSREISTVYHLAPSVSQLSEHLLAQTLSSLVMSEFRNLWRRIPNDKLHLTDEKSVLVDNPQWPNALVNLERLEYFSRQFSSYMDSTLSVMKLYDLIDEVLDTSSSGVDQVLSKTHEMIVATSYRKESLFKVYQDLRRTRSLASFQKDTLKFVERMLVLQTNAYTIWTWACMVDKDNASTCEGSTTYTYADRMEEQGRLLQSRVISAFTPPVKRPFSFCSCHGCHSYVGDFNGDSKMDLMCYKSGTTRTTFFSNRRKHFSTSGTPWQSTNMRCSSNRMMVGKFSRDSRMDILCTNPSGRSDLQMYYSNSRGNIDRNVGWEGTQPIAQWCRDEEPYTRFLVGDFNGDRKTDILCQNVKTGDLRISSRPTSHILNAWRWTMHWCRTGNSQLFVGDFNGDSRDDLLCHDWKSGHSSIAYAERHGTFMSGPTWESGGSFCTDRTRRQLYIGDFNGDRKSDLLCYEHTTHGLDHLDIMYATRSGNFISGLTYTMRFDWGVTSRARLRTVADVNGDGRDDLLCYDNNNFLSISLSENFLHFP